MFNFSQAVPDETLNCTVDVFLLIIEFIECELFLYFFVPLFRYFLLCELFLEKSVKLLFHVIYKKSEIWNFNNFYFIFKG